MLYITDIDSMCYISKNLDVTFTFDNNTVNYIGEGLIHLHNRNDYSNYKLIPINEFITKVHNSSNKNIYVHSNSLDVVSNPVLGDLIYAPNTGKCYTIDKHHRPDIQQINIENFGKRHFKHAVIIQRNNKSTLFDQLIKE